MSEILSELEEGVIRPDRDPLTIPCRICGKRLNPLKSREHVEACVRAENEQLRLWLGRKA